MIISKKHITLFIFFLIAFNTNYVLAQKTTCSNGICDLRSVDLSKSVLLYGTWEFYWHKFYSPDYLKTITPQSKDFILANGSWESYKINGKSVGAWGYATYHLKILAPAGNYSISFHQVVSAYKVWINDSLCSVFGKIGIDRKSSIPRPGNNIVNFQTKNDTIDLVIQVSNFSHTAGGLQEKIVFGTTKSIFSLRKKNLSFKFMSIGAELIFIFFFLGLFFTKDKNINYLLLAIGIVFMIMFESVNGEAILLSIFPDLTWNFAKKIDFFSGYNRSTFFILFVWFSFKEYKVFEKWIIFILMAVPFVLSIYVLFSDSYYFSKTLIYFMGLSIISFLYLLFGEIRGIFKKVPYSSISTFGIFILLSVMINDILFGLNYVNTGYFLSYGLVVFIMSHSIVISLKFSEKTKTIEDITKSNLIIKEIIAKTINFETYNLKAFLEVIDLYLKSEHAELWVKNKILSCECVKIKDEFVCANLENNFKSSIDENFFNEVVKNKSNTVLLNEIYVPIYQDNNLKALFYIKRQKNFKISQTDIDIVEKLKPYLSNIIDNYVYYWEIDNLNKNLEILVDRRTEQIFNQKIKLNEQILKLSEKIEQLSTTSKIISDIYEELLERQIEIQKYNEILENVKFEIETQKQDLEFKQKQIHDSIKYAISLRNAFIRSYEQEILLKDSFVLNMPKDIISGDFYSVYSRENYTLITLINTTAINVTAVFLSFVISYMIEEIINENTTIISSPNLIIDNLIVKYRNLLETANANKSFFDSFKISLCSVEMNTGKAKFSLIGQDALIIRKHEPIIIKGKKSSIGGIFEKIDFVDSPVNMIDFKNNDIIYLYSDGFIRQKGNFNHEPLGEERFIEYLKEASKLIIDKQKDYFETKIHEWKGTNKLYDDFTIFGFSFKFPDYTDTF